MPAGPMTPLTEVEIFDICGTLLSLDTHDLANELGNAWAMIRRDQVFDTEKQRYVDWRFVAVWGGGGSGHDIRYSDPTTGVADESLMRHFLIEDPATIAWLEMLSIHNVSWQAWNAACHQITGVPIP